MTNQTISNHEALAQRSLPSSTYPDNWTEIPPNGRVCPFCGLKHARLYSLLGKSGIARRFVRVANLREPGATQGKTLFHVGDMLRFLDHLAMRQGAGQERTKLTD